MRERKNARTAKALIGQHGVAYQYSLAKTPMNYYEKTKVREM
jgi:hypothetical protein